MRCRKSEHWISDLVDGALSPSRRRKLETHLAGCEACRAYRDRLLFLHEEIRETAAPAVSPASAADFSERLERRLRAAPERTRTFRRWIPAAGLAAASAAALLILLLLPGRAPAGAGEPVVLSMAGTMREVAREFGGDAELEGLFNALLEESIDEALDDLDPGSGLEDNPLLWQDLSEADLKFLESELKKEIKS